MAAITHFSLKFKNHFKKVLVDKNNTLAQTIDFVNISSFKHVNPIIF